jgi:hypothetical protein
MDSPGHCTRDTCPVTDGYLSYQPSLEASVFMLAAFSILVPINCLLGKRYRSPLYATPIVAGLLLELVGYAGRLLLRRDVADTTYFAMYLAGIILGPTFISAAIYPILPHVVVIYGRDLAIVSRPIYINVLFLLFGIATLLFQLVGVALAVNGTSHDEVRCLREARDVKSH